MKFRNRFELSQALMPFVASIHKTHYKAWLCKPLTEYEEVNFNRYIREFEIHGKVYEQPDLGACISLMYDRYWDDAMFTFAMSHARLPCSISTLLRMAVTRNSSLVDAICRCGAAFGLDMGKEENGYSLISYCIQHAPLKVSSVMNYIPTHTLSDPRWIRTLTSSVEKMKYNEQYFFARPVFNTLLQYADVHGDGIQLAYLTAEDKFSVTQLAPDLIEKEQQQRDYMQNQITLAERELLKHLIPDIMALIRSFYLIA